MIAQGPKKKKNKPQKVGIEGHLFRCSSLGKIMGDGKAIGLTDNQKKDLQILLDKDKRTAIQEAEMQRLIEKRECKHEFSLSQTAKTYVEGLVEQEVLGYEKDFYSKETQKGNLCEPEAIELYSQFLFEDFKKNTISRRNKYIKGTCDIDFSEHSTIIDTKCPWTKETFPALPEHGENIDYEWQMRGYMMLYKRDFTQVVYCLITTPFTLLTIYDNEDLHYMEDLPIEQRITVVNYTRCSLKEEKIKEKVLECRRYGVWYREKLLSKNKTTK